MPTYQYKTVPDELLEFTDIIHDEFQNHGFRVRVEQLELGFPYTPTFLCRRGQITTTIVELDSKIRLKRLDDWVRYGRSCGKDTRLALCLPSSVNVSAEEHAFLQDSGVGLYAVFTNRLVERLAPADLALNIALPELGTFPAKIRELLGPAYEQFSRAQWREGFEDACQAFEAEARRYLKRWSRSTRITLVRKGGLVALTNKQINKLTMGGLAHAFADISSPNHADTVIGRTLTMINRERVGVAHHKARVATEKRLRTNVGQHMWAIIAALKEVI